MFWRKPRRQLKIYEQGGQWRMHFCGDETGDVFYSKNERWICGAFMGDRSTMLIMTDRLGVVVRFQAGLVTHREVSDSGVIAVKEFGSGSFCRIQFFSPRGEFAFPKRVKKVGDIVALSFPNGEACLASYSDGASVEIDTASLEWREVPGSIVCQA